VLEIGVGLLAIATVLVSIARRTWGRPPLWRSRVAFGGAVLCLASALAVIALDTTAVLETPVLYIAAFNLFEGSLALLSLMAAAGMSAPKWLL
jgi:hypothetical protein